MFGQQLKHSGARHRGRLATPARGIPLAVGLVLGSLVLGTVTPADGAGAKEARTATTLDSPSIALAAIPGSVSVPLKRARAALDRAVTRLQPGNPASAIDPLASLKKDLGQAHRAAIRQIGKPPTDPESDDPPGPPSVLAVLKLDHQVGPTLVPLFDRRRNVELVDALGAALNRAVNRRDGMLDRVIALPPEGAGSDYADSMADTLGQYTSEVKLLQGAVKNFTLTRLSKTALQSALDRVQKTKAKMDRAFGGGE
jgi:hypothetical protein